MRMVPKPEIWPVLLSAMPLLSKVPPERLIRPALAGRPPVSAVEPLACQARLRYHTPPIPAVYVGGRLQLGEPFLGAAPGQAAVLYAGSRVLGGGIISAAA